MTAAHLTMTALPFSFRFIAARDGTRLRTAVCQAANARGVCVLFQGHCEFTEKYGEVVDELAARGFAVATFDWRGQGGSARALSNPLMAHVGDYAEYDDDLTSFLEQVVKPISPAPPLALAHSMGAHILLRSLHTRPGAFCAAVLTAPMQAIATRGYPAPLARAVARLQVLAGRGGDFVWGVAERDPLLVDFAMQRCTSDPARFARTQEIIRNHPAIRLAGPTWGWLAATYRSMAQQARPGHAEAITTPVLVFGAGRDRIVETEATRAFAARLPHGRYIELAPSEHEILMEADCIRARFWQAFDVFADGL